MSPSVQVPPHWKVSLSILVGSTLPARKQNISGFKSATQSSAQAALNSLAHQQLRSKDLGRHSGMCSSTFRVNSIGYTPLGLIFRGDRGQGTVGTTRGTRHDIKHIGLHWIHTFGSIDISFIYLSIDTAAMYLRRSPKRAKT